MDVSFGSSTGQRQVDLALPVSVAAALAASVLFVHLPDFLRTIVSANDGLYAVVAREVFNGRLPYITAWEAKPPLFFVLLAAAMHITGVSLASLHVASLVAGFVTAYFVYRIGLAFGEGGRIGLFAALLTVALSASNKGTSAEAEVFVNAFASAALAVIAPTLATRTLTLRCAFIAALLSGCAIEMKVTALPTALTAAAFAIFASASGAVAAFVVACGILAPIVASALPYFAVGRVDAFADANIGTVLRRISSRVAHPHLYESMRWEVEALFPVWALIPLGFLRRWSAPERSLGIMLVAWLGAAIVSLLAVREYFGYHFITLEPPACLLAAWGFYRTWPSRAAQRYALAIAMLSILGHGIGRYFALAEPDQEAQAATILRRFIAQQPGSLYVAQGDPALYVLTGEPIPTRFPYPQHLYAADMQAAANTDGMREVTRILATQPLYIVLRPGRENPQNSVLHAVHRAIDRGYALRATSGEYHIYEHKRSRDVR
jgi:hypothetical protein